MILDKIIDKTKSRVEYAKSIISYDKIKLITQKSKAPFSFEQALKTNDISFICEVKKASPSKGIISESFPYMQIAKEYENAGSAAISVLTEPDFFMGRNEYLTQIKKKVKIPILRKDFIVDEYQIYEASLIGADAILLICSILNTYTINKYIKIADSLGLSCLVEAHNEAEVNSAIAAGARIIGVNNRNLNTFTVDINNSINLRRLVPEDIIFVSESGISTSEDIKNLRENGTNAVLIGETLMKSDNIKLELDKLRGTING